jgi:hypothetical protein
VAPLYTTDPRQMPFFDGEQQTEERWVVEVALQVNPTVTLGQQFAGELTVIATPIEAAFSP